MYRTTLFIASTLLTASGVLCQNSTVQCAPGLKMFVSRGTGEEMGVGATGALVDIIAQQINGSDVEAIEYPASLDDPLYFQSVSNGTTSVKEAITNYVAACPGSKMAVFGYSQGAQISSNALCGTPPIWGIFNGLQDVPEVLAFAQPLPANVTKNVVSAVLFGDPTHRGDAPYNYGNGTGSGVFWRHDISPCEALGSRIRSYCDAGDPFCDVSYDPDIYTHAKYIQRYGIDVAQFVVGQYYNNGGTANCPNGTGVTPGLGLRLPALLRPVSQANFRL